LKGTEVLHRIARGAKSKERLRFSEKVEQLKHSARDKVTIDILSKIAREILRDSIQYVCLRPECGGGGLLFEFLSCIHFSPRYF
jgi:hypothetical protein